jgi:hypothetical protein
MRIDARRAPLTKLPAPSLKHYVVSFMKSNKPRKHYNYNDSKLTCGRANN